MGRRKSGGFVYKRYAAKTQNSVNIISNVCGNLVLQKIEIYIASNYVITLFRVHNFK